MSDIVGQVTDIPTIEMLEENWDILFYNRLSPLDQDWDEVRKQMTCKIVMDMDDDWMLPPNHLNYYDYLERKPIIENNFRYADLVTCTNQNIAERVYPFNKNIQIFPNALPYGHHQFTEDKREDERIRIFWAGGVTHQHDLEILKYPLQRLKPLANRIKMVLYTSSPAMWAIDCGGAAGRGSVCHREGLGFHAVIEAQCSRAAEERLSSAISKPAAAR
jgi:hypothetical protein